MVLKVLAGLVSLIALLLALGLLNAQQHNVSLSEQLTTTNRVLDDTLRELSAAEERHVVELAVLKKKLNLAEQSKKKLRARIQRLEDGGGIADDADSSTVEFLQQANRERLDTIVEKKYAILFPELALSGEEKERFRQLLRDREKVLNTPIANYFTDDMDVDQAVIQQQMLLQEVDAEVARLIGADGLEQYELIKESGFEQYQFEQFKSELPAESRLTADQGRAVLFAKLQQKQVYQGRLNELRQVSGQSDKDMKMYQEALSQYQTNYLQAVRSLMSDEQYKLLQAFEAEQFQQMRASLEHQFHTASE